ncbi:MULTISPECIES: hypothetical protein [unclassified Microbulbifer]|uniref:hypothetical protein n=1 Tax=unclassified Microbulbifer TaxID=2619833 RepID=UPI0027E3EF01|nr:MULTISPECIES: hypothetical protein [unclassified Microbulbifer]
MSGIFEWIKDELGAFFQWCWEKILNAFAYLLELIPVPDFANNLGSLVSQVPESVWFFAQVSELKYGATVISLAIAGRFIIRRLPVVG